MKRLILSMVFSVFMIPSANADRTRISEEFNANSNGVKLAHLVDYEVVDGYMTIKVLTAGCTGINSFKVVADNHKANSLKVLRIKRDECGMKLRPIKLQYSIRHLGLDINQSISLINNPLN